MTVADQTVHTANSQLGDESERITGCVEGIERDQVGTVVSLHDQAEQRHDRPAPESLNGSAFDEQLQEQPFDPGA